MRLREVTLPMDMDIAYEAVWQYAVEYERQPNLDAAVEYLLKNRKYQYEGKMFRGIAFDLKKMMQAPDLQQFFQQIQQPDRNKFVSWSQTFAGMRTAIGFNIDAAMYDFEFAGFLVIQQHGLALDIEKLFAGATTWVDKESEEELLAETNKSAQVLGIDWAAQLFKPNELDKLKAAFEAELEYYD